MKIFISRLLLFSVIVGVIDFAWNTFMQGNKIPAVAFILTFFIASTYIFHVLSLSYSQKKPQAFIRFYMAITGIRMAIYFLIILAYRFYDKETVVQFAIGFFTHYLLFTFFEIPVLLRQLKNQEQD